jgi:aspartyl protease family protein
LLWVLLLGLTLALLVLIVRHDEGTVAGFATHDFASLAIRIALLIFIGASVLVLFRERFAEAIEAALFWVALAVLLVAAYAYRADLREVADRVVAELIPGHGVVRGLTVEIARGRSGQFQVDTQVNGAHVNMILDTGASAVVLTQEAAKEAGLPLDFLSYNVTIETANGRTRAATIKLDRIVVGSIIEREVPALIAQPGQLRNSLLGMSFLNRLESWEVRGGTLLLRGKE